MIQEHEHQSQMAAGTKEHLKRQLHEAAHETKATTRRAVETMRERYAQVAEDCKVGMATRLSHVGEALHEAASRLRGEGDSNVADGIDAAAQKVAEISDHLQHQDLQGLRRETENFTRRHPEWVYGGLFVAGLAVARLLKASAGGTAPTTYGGADGVRDFESEWDETPGSSPYGGTAATGGAMSNAPGMETTSVGDMGASVTGTEYPGASSGNPPSNPDMLGKE